VPECPGAMEQGFAICIDPAILALLYHIKWVASMTGL
jgi:hypothetical protein